jgi:hypothetical protein
MYEYPQAADTGLGTILMLLAVGLYVYFAFCQMKMAQKIGLLNSAWWAWVPIMNTFLLFKMAGKPNWWFFLCLIPLVNIIAFAILWMEAAKAVDNSPVWGFLVLVPFINFVAIGVLAFSAPPTPHRTPPPHEPKPYQPANVG